MISRIRGRVGVIDWWDSGGPQAGKRCPRGLELIALRGDWLWTVGWVLMARYVGKGQNPLVTTGSRR